MRKILLILFLILTITLTGYTADLFGTYDQRIKFTVDHTKIDSELTWFPVTLHFTDSQAEEIFAEFDADEDFDRCAITTSDEETQIYGDCEAFDDSESKAIYHVSKTGWTVDPDTDTDGYFYYDNDADHNTTYISKSGGTAAQSVWDTNFKAVYHMNDYTTSEILDSTSNTNNGTKKGANEPVEATGKVGQGQDFDGSDDYINVGDSGLDPGENDFTIETLFSRQAKDAYHRLFNKRTYTPPQQWYDIVLHTDNTIKLTIAIQYGTIGEGYQKTATKFEDATYHYHAAVFDRDGNLQSYVDGASDGDPNDISANAGNLNPDKDAYIGSYRGTDYAMNGIIDEQRISFTLRSADWIAATYDSLWDTLLTYGSEEASGITWNTVEIGKWNTVEISKWNGIE